MLNNIIRRLQSFQNALIFRVKKSTVKLISKCIVAFILFCGSVCLFPETLYWFFRNFTGSSLSLLQHCPGHSYEDNASCKETSFGKIGQWPVQFAAFSISICICICIHTCICICICICIYICICICICICMKSIARNRAASKTLFYNIHILQKHLHEQFLRSDLIISTIFFNSLHVGIAKVDPPHL